VNEPHLNAEDWKLLQNDDPVKGLAASPFKAWRLAEAPKFVDAYLAAVTTLRDGGVHSAIEAAI
jgi:hypothetical protein